MVKRSLIYTEFTVNGISFVLCIKLAVRNQWKSCQIAKGVNLVFAQGDSSARSLVEAPQSSPLYFQAKKVVFDPLSMFEHPPTLFFAFEK